MATTGQFIFIRLAALVVAIAAAWWWRSRGFGWLGVIATAIGGYVVVKIVIGVAVGLY